LFLYHYYEKSRGPFRSISELTVSEAQAVLDGIKAVNKIFAAHRYNGYIERRHELEQKSRELFAAKGGKPIRRTPHYMVVEACPWLETWYNDSAYVKIPFTDFDSSAVSFTYGDMFPTFSPRVCDGKEYRGQLYRFVEIMGLIEKYGLPQLWNGDGRFGPERYIEAQVWSDDAVIDFIKNRRDDSLYNKISQ